MEAAEHREIVEKAFRLGRDIQGSVNKNENAKEAEEEQQIGRASNENKQAMMQQFIKRNKQINMHQMSQRPSALRVLCVCPFSMMYAVLL